MKVALEKVKDLREQSGAGIMECRNALLEAEGDMEKALAIVTDEGGITCHAAIVAREMNKPCVIGTKIATKVFHHGDIIEVDANKGIVRKIQKA